MMEMDRVLRPQVIHHFDFSTFEMIILTSLNLVPFIMILFAKL